MTLDVNLSVIIAFIALCLSAYSMKKTSDFNKRQNDFIETNNKLNKLLLEKETEEVTHKDKADISANFIKIGKRHRLKVFNKGKGTAKNVRIEFPEGNELFITSDLTDKFPIPILEEHQNVELFTSVHLQSPNRITTILLWDDDFAVDNSKVLTPTRT